MQKISSVLFLGLVILNNSCLDSMPQAQKRQRSACSRNSAQRKILAKTKTKDSSYSCASCTAHATQRKPLLRIQASPCGCIPGNYVCTSLKCLFDFLSIPKGAFCAKCHVNQINFDSEFIVAVKYPLELGNENARNQLALKFRTNDSHFMLSTLSQLISHGISDLVSSIDLTQATYDGLPFNILENFKNLTELHLAFDLLDIDPEILFNALQSKLPQLRRVFINGLCHNFN